MKANSVQIDKNY